MPEIKASNPVQGVTQPAYPLCLHVQVYTCTCIYMYLQTVKEIHVQCTCTIVTPAQLALFETGPMHWVTSIHVHVVFTAKGVVVQ